MKRHLCAIALAFLAVAAAPPPKPAGLDVARKTFVATVKAKTWSALADLVWWPLPIENYGSPPSIARAAYLKDHTKLSVFLDDAGLRRCIAAKTPEYQGDHTQFGFGSWLVDCNGNEFYFGSKAGKVLFTGYQNVNE